MTTVTELRYDPSRLAPLRARAAAAFQHLLAAASSDPAAASALRVSALVRSRLENEWLPAIDRVMSSDAMTTWMSRGPAWMRGLSGHELGVALAEQADELCFDAREERVAAMVDALEIAAGDREALRTFFRELGPDRLLELVTKLAVIGQHTTALPDAMRDAFVRTAADGGLPSGYAANLVRAAARAHTRSGTDADALTLSYLMHGGQLPTTFLVEAVDAMITVERQHAADEGLDDWAAWTLWLSDPLRTPSALRDDFADLGEDGLAWPVAGDPMYALLGQLARDGRAGRAVFTDRSRAKYLFAQRDVLADGGEAVTAAASTAAAGPDVVPGAPRQLIEDASLVASGFVDHFGRTNAAAADRSDTVTIAAARVLGAHLFAVDVALSGHDLSDEERVANLAPNDRAALQDAGLLTEDGRLREGTVMATGELHHDVLGPHDARNAAVFESAPLEEVIVLAAGTDIGAYVLRDALATYQRGLASAAAARIAAGEVVDPDRYVAEVTLDAARLEGRFVEHVGHEAERRGRDADATMAFWINAAGNGANHLSGLLGTVGSTVIGAAIDPAVDAAADTYATAEADAEADADELARLAGEQLAYLWYRELFNAGVIDAALPPDLTPGGRLPGHSELVRRVYARSDWTVERVLNELDVATSDAGVDLDGRALRDALAVAQLPHYQELTD